MKIDKSRLHKGIWYEDVDGNYIPSDPMSVDAPENAHTAHVCFPLEVTERIYFIEEVDGRRSYKGKPALECYCHIGDGSAPTILGMVNSGDYTLSEAIALLAECCERCSNALSYKYTDGKDGYPEYSEEWHRCNTVCDHCREEEE